VITDAIILAAGASTRLGRPKQLLRFRGETLLARTIGAVRAAPIRRVLVVLGAQAALMRAQLAGDAVEAIENLDWRMGIGSSIRAGMHALPEPCSAAVLLVVCDQPLLSAAHLAALVEIHRRTSALIVASHYGDDVSGVPALFSRAVFGELAALPAHSGAKSIIERHRDATVLLPFCAGTFDIDTENDYQRLLTYD
jgi:molybdenum cofactor cytidylyltransferase